MKLGENIQKLGIAITWWRFEEGFSGIKYKGMISTPVLCVTWNIFVIDFSLTKF
jgi:hypothetical protein